jgi:hypothetical protein
MVGLGRTFLNIDRPFALASGFPPAARRGSLAV